MLQEELKDNSSASSSSSSSFKLPNSPHLNGLNVSTNENSTGNGLSKSQHDRENGIMEDNQEMTDLNNRYSYERSPTHQLHVKKKLREFYTAPITKFWLWSITYFAFLVVFTYTMLIATPPTPEWHEIYVIVFMATFGCEKIREIFASEPVKLRQKLSVWSSSIWNCCDAFFVLFFFVAFSLRMQDGHTLEIGRVLYCLNIIYWYLKK